MIRKDLISPLQQTVPGIILLVLQRWNQQFNELGASLHCSTGLKGKLLFWIAAVAGSHKTAVLAGGRVCSRVWDEISTNLVRKKKKNRNCKFCKTQLWRRGQELLLNSDSSRAALRSYRPFYWENEWCFGRWHLWRCIISFEKGTESSTPTERARGPAEDWHLNAAFFFKPGVRSSGLVDTNASGDPNWGTDWIPCPLQQTPPPRQLCQEPSVGSAPQNGLRIVKSPHEQITLEEFFFPVRVLSFSLAGCLLRGVTGQKAQKWQGTRTQGWPWCIWSGKLLQEQAPRPTATSLFCWVHLLPFFMHTKCLTNAN